MANNENLIPIPGRLHSVATEGHVAGADEVFDDSLNKSQATINQEVQEAIGSGGSVDSRIAAAINALDSEKSQSASAANGGLNLSITETDGKIASISGSIASNTYDAYGAASSEASRAQSAETALSNRVGSLETTVGPGGSIDTRIENAVDEALENGAFLGNNDGTTPISSFDPVSEVSNLKSRVNAAENDIDGLQEAYRSLSQSQPIPVTELPVTGEAGKIYRLAGTSSYADYMYAEGALTTPIKMAEYDNAIDDEPTVGSHNLVESGSVYAEVNGNKVGLLGLTFNYENAYYQNLYFGYTIKSGTIIKRITTNTYFIPVDGSSNIYVSTSTIPYTLTKDIKGVIPTTANSGQVVFDGELEKQLIQDTKKIYFSETGLNSSNGSYTTNNSLASTLSIPVKEGDIITSEFIIHRIAQFNENKEFIYPLIDPSSNTYTIPSGVAYIKIAYYSTIAYGWIKNNGQYVTPEILKQIENIASYSNATTSKSGLMSASDKTKLDGIPNGGYNYDISVEGSGITKNASAFGFLPSKTADENFTALQTAINGGGTILVDMPGEYALCGTILIPSNTTLVFGNNVFIRYAPNSNGVYSYYMFLNAGAESRTYNENIKIVGLSLLTNDTGPTGGNRYVMGLRGYLSFFYIKNLLIEDLNIQSNAEHGSNFNVHICTFENVIINRVRIKSGKDGLHFGKGKGLVISNGSFNTGDDPIALNAQDYPSANPEFGWIEDVVIRNIIDENRSAEFPSHIGGRSILFLGGGWNDWENGKTYLTNGDVCVANNCLYRTYGEQGQTAVASTMPANTALGSVSQGADGLRWICMQNNNVGYTAGIRNVSVENLSAEQPRGSVFLLTYENNPRYCQSYSANAPLAIYENFAFKNIIQKATCSSIFGGAAPIRNIKYENSCIKSDTLIAIGTVNVSSPSYPDTKIVLDGVTFAQELGTLNIIAETGRSIDIKTYGSFILGNLSPQKTGIVTSSSNDIGLS